MQFKEKKSREQSLGLITFYFVLAAVFVAASGWIENLGVVPLFLFSAFLLDPAFLAFLNLLFVVTHVLETIGKLPYYRIFQRGIITSILSLFRLKSFKPFFLPIFNPCVKGFFQILPLAIIFSIGMAHAEDIVLGKGETYIIPESPLEKFSVLNKEVISYKFQEKSKALIIRGVKLGTSEIAIWKHGASTPELKQVFVISKTQESKLLQISQSIRLMGLSTEMAVPHLRVKGEIKTKSQFLNYKKFLKKNGDVLIDESTVELDLKKQLLADIYLVLLNDFKDQTKCNIDHTSLIKCYCPPHEKLSASLKQDLEDTYAVKFLETNTQKLSQNYWFKIKLIQLEQLDGEEIKLGLEELNTSIGEILKSPLNKIIEKNTIILGQKKISMSTLAEPQGIIRPQSPAEFQVGAEIPYKAQSENKDSTSTHTQWQFAGLKIKMVIENNGEQIKTNFETELTKPNADESSSISGSKEKSSAIVNLEEPLILFQISLKTDALGTNQMPFLNRIPILGELFKSKSSQSNFKTIMCILEIKNHQ